VLSGDLLQWSAAAGPASQHQVSPDTIFTKIEYSDRIYNIEFKIWGVKKRKLYKIIYSILSLLSYFPIQLFGFRGPALFTGI
jgi:hypothetical protein